jgi:hypothetical protein
MSMYVEVISRDWNVFGDGVTTEAKMNMAAWPFNTDFKGIVPMEAEAYMVFKSAEVRTPHTEQFPCEVEGTFIILKFLAPVPQGEHRTVRIRGKVFV